MKVYENLNKLPSFDKPVITIGSFDGLHYGHMKIIDKIIDLAQKNATKSIVLTFHPHPRQVVYPDDNSLELLSTKSEKITLFKGLGIDYLVFIPFSLEFSQQSPQEYIGDFIVENFNPGNIVIGYDHKFGKNRKGDIELLREYRVKYRYAVTEIPPQQLKDISISSTKIRNALSKGKVDLANQWLGHPYLLHGEVVHGEKIGNKLGFPTANLKIENKLKLIPPNGIYAVNVTIDNDDYQGMLYIGSKPTFNENDNKRVIEVNIFNFSSDIYGKVIGVEFLKFIREDQKFKSSEDLITQLNKDKKVTQEILRNMSHES